ncbi:MAG: hypothetical protein M3492_04360 [Actinomycetota bacterium]|nr:hypothetical protein [Actinomycetota bacterium]
MRGAKSVEEVMVPDLTRRQLLLGAAAISPFSSLRPNPAFAAVEDKHLPLVPAMPARAAFDSYGMNCHLSFLGSPSWGNTDAALRWLLELGVGAVRQYLPRTDHGRAVVRRAMGRLTGTGVRWCAPILLSQDVTSLDAARSAVREQLDWLQDNTDLDLLDSLTGPNEPNSASRAPDWARTTRWAMQALWEETRKRSAFDDVLVQGPPLNMKGGPPAVAPDVAALGDLSMWMDRGDVHLYPNDEDPEYLIDERLVVLEPVHPGKPLCVSEGGYTTSIDRGYGGGAWLVPPAVASLYAPKHLFVHALEDRKFFAYELLDEPPPYDSDDTIREAGFGLVETPSPDPRTWVRKPGFEATRRLLALVRDNEGRRTPAGLRVSITTPADVGGATQTDTLRSALLHRSDGRHLLAIWQAVDIYKWDRNELSGTYLPVEPLQVAITLERPLPIAVYEPSLRDGPISKFTAETFTQSVGVGLVVVQIG